jgi:hypothetical protein
MEGEDGAEELLRGEVICGLCNAGVGSYICVFFAVTSGTV